MSDFDALKKVEPCNFSNPSAAIEQSRRTNKRLVAVVVANTTLERPNVEGNRRADGMRAEDQAMCRRVRLTVTLGVTLMELNFALDLHRDAKRQLCEPDSTACVRPALRAEDADDEVGEPVDNCGLAVET